jgi:uncharacterized protein (DUF4415 family)
VQKEERIVRYTASELREKIARGETLTDWDAVDAMTEEEIERNALEDDLEHGPFDLDGPVWVGGLPGQAPAKLQLTLRIDEDVIDWFKSQGKGYQTRMNAVLRQYMEHEKGRPT